ncbi:MAG: metallophosphoesterase [Imperialibacter sp.]|uniref:metallophosphoesterase n=1 Tax=Imperialibacter sp. TaxID=2038411 RepID=UPI0032F06ACB
MTASKFLVIPILTCVLLLIDWYVWQALKVVFHSSGGQTLEVVKWAFWSLTVAVLLGLWAYNFVDPELLGVKARTFILSSLFVVYCSKLVSVAFLLIDDAARFVRWAANKISPGDDLPAAATSSNGKVITRSEFLMKASLMAAAIPATALTWGIVSGAHDYRLRRVRLVLNNLPRAFEGMTIGQISDIHTGSFFNKTAAKGGVEMLLKEKPDMVFFTGDLVNDRAWEVKDYLGIFDKVKAPMGVFSTLGNHDYGAYLKFPDQQARQQNLDDIRHAHKLMGYDLLVDENRIITLGGEKLAIIGVENISATESIFPANNHLATAVKGSDEAAVKLLLSHDPSHWNMEVTPHYKEIDMTFSGHTHGLQFGVTLGGKTYSPAQLQYKQWAGLYRNGTQQLYVNRGFGYLGYPGRVGMPPEITIFELAGS